MDLKKTEVQQKIVKAKENNETSEEEFLAILRQIAPGTHMRTALDGALKAGKGALIAVENELLPNLLDGGFRINTRFTPQKLIELTKMDGAIILSKDMKKINYANVLLTPSSKIKSSETGTRHKAAERTAKQAETFVIAISERKNEITLFYKKKRYPLLSTDDLLRKANEHIQILEKQRELFDYHISSLTKLELRNQPSLAQAISAIQKGVIVQKISSDVQRYIIELGKEGILLRTRLREITQDVERETDLIIKDYTSVDVKRSKLILESLSYDGVLDKDEILKALTYDGTLRAERIKGWRVLSKTSLSDAEVAALLREVEYLGVAVHSNVSRYVSVLGRDRAETFRDEITRIKADY